MGKNAEPQKERRSKEPGSNGPVFTWRNWRNFKSSSQVNPSLKKSYPARTADPAWVLFQVNACKHLTAKGLPTWVIQPGLKSSPGSCKEGLPSDLKSPKVVLSRPKSILITQCYKGRFTRYDFVARDKFTIGLRHDFRTIYTRTTFSLVKLNMQKFAPGFTERKF